MRHKFDKNLDRSSSASIVLNTSTSQLESRQQASDFKSQTHDDQELSVSASIAHHQDAQVNISAQIEEPGIKKSVGSDKPKKRNNPKSKAKKSNIIKKLPFLQQDDVESSKKQRNPQKGIMEQMGLDQDRVESFQSR